MKIETHNLIKRYGERTVVDHVNVEVEQGTIVGLLGPNGAGKTTTFYMIVGIIQPDEGDVTVDGTSLVGMPIYKRHQFGIGYLPQEASVFRKMTVWENLMSLLETRKELTPDVSEMESYRDLILENIEYDHLCREFTTYREDLDEIVELMVETVCAKRKTTRIAGSDFPHEVVRSRFLKLDSEHIRFVMDSLQKNTTEVRNMKQYLLAVLFNAPTTISNHYTAQVNHDMYAGGW